MSGLGAATADARYGLIASLGLTVLTNGLINQQFWFQIFGGIFLGYLGVKIYKSKPPSTLDKGKKKAEYEGIRNYFLLNNN
ncbi:LysE type translocator [compost metagenome]